MKSDVGAFTSEVRAITSTCAVYDLFVGECTRGEVINARQVPVVEMVRYSGIKDDC
jgi:hypothetical protein